MDGIFIEINDQLERNFFCYSTHYAEAIYL